MLQRSVREFVDTRLAPLEREIEEKDEIPRAVIDAMGGMGLFGLGFREELGGQGFGKLGYCVAVEQLARANASLWNVIGGSGCAGPRSTSADPTRSARGTCRTSSPREGSARTVFPNRARAATRAASRQSRAATATRM